MQSKHKMQGQMRDQTQCETDKDSTIDNMSNVNKKNSKSGVKI